MSRDCCALYKLISANIVDLLIHAKIYHTFYFIRDIADEVTAAPAKDMGHLAGIADEVICKPLYSARNS